MANYDDVYGGGSVDVLKHVDLEGEGGGYQTWRATIIDHGPIDFNETDPDSPDGKQHDPSKRKAYFELAGCKAYVPSKTNYLKMKGFLGNDCDQWIGQTILLRLERHTYGSGGKWIVPHKDDGRAVDQDFSGSVEDIAELADVSSVTTASNNAGFA